MSGTKFERTPGPWETFPARPHPEDRVGVQSRAGLLVADCGLASNAYTIGNARLIAKADAALGLLERMLDLHIAHHNHPIHAEARTLIAELDTDTEK